METLWQIVQSMQQVAQEAGVYIVTGDTKVVDRGKGDGLYINTAGIGTVTYEKAIFNSNRVRERLGAPKRFAYGPTAIEAVDVFPARQPNAPVHIYIHGGAWRQRKAAANHPTEIQPRILNNSIGTPP